MELLIAAAITVVVATATVFLMLLGVNVVLLRGLRARIPQTPFGDAAADVLPDRHV
jgi:hypothetical protein